MFKKTKDKKQKKQKTKTGNSEYALEVKAFSKKYKGRTNYAVQDLSFTIKPGEFHGFIGANGAGKTTTIKSLIGAYSQENYEGDIFMFGHNNLTIEAKKRVGYIPETAVFPKGFSALEYIASMSYLSGLTKRRSKEFAKDILVEVGLKELMGKSPNTFSSGQKKKVLLAQALVHDPDIIIMDEPAANLDPEARFEFFESLHKLQLNGKAIFISSHILSELEKFVDSITIIDGGKIAYTGSVKDAKEHSHFVYDVKVDESELFEKYLKKEKVKYNFSEEKFIIDFEDEKQVHKVHKFIIENKLHISTFNSIKPTLEDIYLHYVKLGSVDTKGQDVKRDNSSKEEIKEPIKESEKQVKTVEEPVETPKEEKKKKPVVKKKSLKKNIKEGENV